MSLNGFLNSKGIAMVDGWVRGALVCVPVVLSLLGFPGTANAQTVVRQLLDRVYVVSPNAVLDMSFKDPASTPQFDNPGVSGANLTACQLTGTQGLFCLDQLNGKIGRLVRSWNPVSAGADRPLFSCEDSALVKLGFDVSRSTETCTGLTAGGDGAIYVAGKKKSVYSLIKVVEKGNGSCGPTGEWAGADLDQEPYPDAPAVIPKTEYCYKQLPLWKDRPLLVDITATSLVLTTASNTKIECSGVLGLEERKTLMFFPDPDLNGSGSACGTSPVVIANSKQWGLTGSEQLQSASILRTSEDNPATPENETATFAVATTGSGLVKAKDTSAAAASALLMFNVPAERQGRSVPFKDRQCDMVSEPHYGVRTSTKSGLVYVTDRNWCEVLALEPSRLPLVAYVPESNTGGFRNVVDKNKVDLTLTTWQCPVENPADPSCSTYFPPLEPTTAPGESVDLSECGGGKTCTLATKQSDPTAGAAFLSSVKLASDQTGLTLFQIQNIPDCRWLLKDRNSGGPAVPAICNTEGVVTGGSTAATQFLDVSKLLPKEVLDQFVKNPLRPMYLQPRYRAQYSAGKYYFDAFFGIPERGVQFQDVFDVEYLVKELEGKELSQSGFELGCRLYPEASWPALLSDLLKWDVLVRISENRLTVGGPDAGATSLAGMISNTNCGSTRGSGPETSIFIFNLEPTTSLAPKVGTTAAKVEPSGEDVLTYARLLVSQFYDLYDAQRFTAKVDVDGNAAPPLPAPVVAQLENTLESARDKLSKCLAAANFPKQSEALRNCNSFDSAMDNYLNVLATVPACVVGQPCNDVANRRGELKARVLAIRFVKNQRFLPSVPSNGFLTVYGPLPLQLPPP
jgi:hypothetical protein